jgi:hypothetical protein
MIEDILEKFTPYLHNGKRLYDEEDVKKMLVSVMQKSWHPHNSNKEVNVEQYPEATC